MHDSPERTFAMLFESVRSFLKPALGRCSCEIESRLKPLTSQLRTRTARSGIALVFLSILVTSLWGQVPGGVIAPSMTELVNVTDSGSGVKDSRADTGPAGERPRTAPSSRSARPIGRDRPLTFEEGFILGAAAPAQASQKETRVPASVTLAQAILESDWGRSGLSTKAKNFFGMKARPDPGPAGVVFWDTWEVINGANAIMNEPFRAYNNMEESFVDHGRFLQKARYAAAFNFAGDPKQFAREIHKAGYATDPGYATKLIALMDKFGLYDFDLK